MSGPVSLMPDLKSVALGLGIFFSCFVLYLIHVNRALASTPAEAQKFATKRWTKEEVREEYERVKKSPTDIAKALPPKKGRRYVVLGGSGMVGYWIVRELLMRGEDPSAIRIFDLKPPSADLTEKGVSFFKTDVTDIDMVGDNFDQPWPSSVAHLKLTVFHVVAYINPADRSPDMLEPYMKVNVRGTKIVLAAAKEAGADCFIMTSSGATGMKVVDFWLMPWQWTPENFVQVNVNGDHEGKKARHDELPGNYVVSKIIAETFVAAADDPENGFRTGIIRPGHGVYAHDVDSPTNLVWSYLSKGGSPTWLSHMTCNFVSAVNAAAAHLQYEHRLTTPISTSNEDIGGRAYAVCDPSGAIAYADVYLAVSTLSSTRTTFPRVPAVLFLLLAHMIEAYTLVHKSFLSDWLPPIKGDMAQLQPAMFSVCTLHMVYDDEKSKQELGFRAPVQSTMEGVCLAVKSWNEKVEEERGKKSV